MNLRQVTTYFILISVVVIIGYDVWVFIKGGGDATISSVIATWAYQYPIMPFCVGVVCGHLFWQMRFYMREK